MLNFTILKLDNLKHSTQKKKKEKVLQLFTSSFKTLPFSLSHPTMKISHQHHYCMAINTISFFSSFSNPTPSCHVSIGFAISIQIENSISFSTYSIKKFWELDTEERYLVCLFLCMEKNYVVYFCLYC